MVMSSEVFSIRGVKGLEVLDSRGNFTLRVCVSTDFVTDCGDAPSGASKGSMEAHELVDDSFPRRVSKAVELVNTLVAQSLVGVDVRSQWRVDALLRGLDGTPNFSKIGGNTAIATSIAVAKTAASALGMEYFEYIGGARRKRIPVPLLNFINGGLHGAGFLDIQEFLVIPLGFSSFRDALIESVKVFQLLKKELASRFGKSAVMAGDEGGFSPPVKSSVDALGLLSKVIESAGFTLGKEFFLGLDVAGSNLFDKRKALYRLDGREFTSGELMDYYRELASTYKLVYLEDPFHEGDFDSFSALQRMLSGTIVVGDDLYVTNQERLLIGCKSKSTRGVIVKPNQVGTLTDAIEFAEMALGCGNLRVVSHRSGDTEDPFIADLAVGVSSEFIKTGAPARGERTSKYNRLLYIEEEYSLEYAGRRVLTMI